MMRRTSASTPKGKSNRPSQRPPRKLPKNKRRQPKKSQPPKMRGKNANQGQLLDSVTLAKPTYVRLLLMSDPELSLRLPSIKKPLSNSEPVQTYSQPRVSPKTFEKESMSVAQRQTLTTALTQPVMLKNTVDTNQAPRTLATDTFLLALMDEIEKRSNTLVGADLVGGIVKKALTPRYETQDTDINLTLSETLPIDANWLKEVVDTVVARLIRVRDDEPLQAKHWYGLTTFKTTNEVAPFDDRAVISLGDSVDIKFSHRPDYAFLDKARVVEIVRVMHEKRLEVAHEVTYLADKKKVKEAIAQRNIDTGDAPITWDKIPKCFKYLSQGYHFKSERDTIRFYKALAEYTQAYTADIRNTQFPSFSKMILLDKKFKALTPTELLHGLTSIFSTLSRAQGTDSADGSMQFTQQETLFLKQVASRLLSLLTRQEQICPLTLSVADKLANAANQDQQHFGKDWENLLLLLGLKRNERAANYQINGSDPTRHNRYSYTATVAGQHYHVSNIRQPKALARYFLTKESILSAVHSLADELEIDLGSRENTKNFLNQLLQAESPKVLTKTCSTSTNAIAKDSVNISVSDRPQNRTIQGVTFLGDQSVINALLDLDTHQNRELSTNTQPAVKALTDQQLDVTWKGLSARLTGLSRTVDAKNQVVIQGKLETDIIEKSLQSRLITDFSMTSDTFTATEKSGELRFQKGIYTGQLKIFTNKQDNVSRVRPRGEGCLIQTTNPDKLSGNEHQLTGSFYPKGLMLLRSSNRLAIDSAQPLRSNWTHWVSKNYRAIAVEGAMDIGSDIQANGLIYLRQKKRSIQYIPANCDISLKNSTASMQLNTLRTEDNTAVIISHLNQNASPFTLDIYLDSVSQNPIARMQIDSGLEPLATQPLELGVLTQDSLPEQLHALLTDDLRSHRFVMPLTGNKGPLRISESIIFTRTDDSIAYWDALVSRPTDNASVQRRDKYGNTLNANPRCLSLYQNGIQDSLITTYRYTSKHRSLVLMASQNYKRPDDNGLSTPLVIESIASHAPLAMPTVDHHDHKPRGAKTPPVVTILSERNHMDNSTKWEVNVAKLFRLNNGDEVSFRGYWFNPDLLSLALATNRSGGAIKMAPYGGTLALTPTAFFDTSITEETRLWPLQLPPTADLTVMHYQGQNDIYVDSYDQLTGEERNFGLAQVRSQYPAGRAHPPTVTVESYDDVANLLGYPFKAKVIYHNSQLEINYSIGGSINKQIKLPNIDTIKADLVNRPTEGGAKLDQDLQRQNPQGWLHLMQCVRSAILVAKYQSFPEVQAFDLLRRAQPDLFPR